MFLQLQCRYTTSNIFEGDKESQWVEIDSTHRGVDINSDVYEAFQDFHSEIEEAEGEEFNDLSEWIYENPDKFEFRFAQFQSEVFDSADAELWQGKIADGNSDRVGAYLELFSTGTYYPSEYYGLVFYPSVEAFAESFVNDMDDLPAKYEPFFDYCSYGEEILSQLDYIETSGGEIWIAS